MTAGIDGGYLADPRLAKVHWQAGDRAPPAVQITVAGESGLWVDPAEIPANEDIGKLGLALAGGADGERDELMANSAAYTGLRWGELTALTIAQVDQAARTITVDRKVVEVGGRLYLEAPKNRKHRRTIYPRRTPAGYPLAERLTARIGQARAEQDAGTNRLARRGRQWLVLRSITSMAFLQTDRLWGRPEHCGVRKAPPPDTFSSSLAKQRYIRQLGIRDNPQRSCSSSVAW
jgi:hypothetical protein